MTYGMLTARYALALVVVGLAALGGYGGMHWVVLHTSVHADMTEHLEKQEDLSQAVLDHATAFVHAKTPAERQKAKDALLAAVGAMESNHNQLVDGADELAYPLDGTPELEAFLTGGGASLDVMVRDYVARVHKLVATDGAGLDPAHPEVHYVLHDGAKKLASHIERAHALFRADAHARVTRLLQFGGVLVGGIWLVLLLEAAFIFRPMARTLEQERAALRQANAELDRLATVDTLTEAYNRRKFAELAQRERATARRSGVPVTLVMLDIDHFKRINDTHGHQAGDAVLKGVAAALRAEIRENDYLVRWGGEEFIVLAPGTGPEGGRALAEKLREAVAHDPIAEVAVTISLGVTSTDGAEEIEAVVQRTDAALYEAKEGGRNQVRCAVPQNGTQTASDATQPGIGA